MGFQAVSNTVQLTVKHNGVGQLLNSRAQWSVYTQLGTDPDQSAVETLADALESWISSDYLSVLSEDWRVASTNVKSLDIEGGPFDERSIDLPGALTGDPPPSNCAMYFRFHGAGGNVPLHGGCFWPVGNEANLDGNNWLSTFRTTCNAVMQELRDNVLDTVFVGQTHVIVSRYASTNGDIQAAREALRAAIAASRRASGLTNDVQSFTLRPEVASQRDRRGGSS